MVYNRRNISQRGLKGTGNNVTQRVDTAKDVSIQTSQIFYKALVIDTISDPALDRESEELYPEELPESQLQEFLSAPRNSLLCRLVEQGNGAVGSTFVCYPFFSSHIALPAKPGEVVWLMRENLKDPEKQKHYWMSRVTESLALEDVNFTSFTRPIQLTHTGSIAPDGRKVFSPNQVPRLGAELKFDDRIDDLSLYPLGSVESEFIHYEPVPRLTKRPGDLALQGSNNTAIILGTDRDTATYNLSKRPNNPEHSNATDAVIKKMGAIDIVVGRGRYFESEADIAKVDRKSGKNPGIKNSTQPFVVSNDLDGFETDKNPAMTQDLGTKPGSQNEEPLPGNKFTNPAEGDPDFLVDACRIYVAETTAVDKNLGLDQIIPAKIQGEKFLPEEGPAIALKSDHIRIVARKAPNEKAKADLLPKGFEGVNGTIRIIKEGDSKSDLSAIIMESDGTIQISGSKIFLGRTTADGGNGKGPGEGKSQPYVRYSDLEKLWQDTMTALDGFCQTLSTHTTPGYGAPSPQITQAAAKLKADAAGLKTAITTIKSERIFGE